MLDRTQSPAFFDISSIVFPNITESNLSNGVEVYSFFDKNISVFKLELVFEAGAKFGSQYALSYFAAKLLLGGTSKRNSSEIIEAFDQFGGFVESSQNNDRLYLTLHGLSIYFEKYLKLLLEVIKESSYSESEFEIQKKISLQSYEVNKEKTSFIASQEFKAQLFGDTLLGKSITDETINEVTIDDLKGFYESYIKHSKFKIFLTGKFDDSALLQINDTFGNLEFQNQNSFNFGLTEFPKNSDKVVHVEAALQSSIRIGKIMFSRSNPDYIPFLVLNTLLGGYFGSRLMTNIREDKGFTYGISSNLVSLVSTGYFMIGTDVKKENTQETIDEINKEIALLQSELVSTEELDLVKNYMKGSLAGSLNTAFEIADKHKVLMIENLDPSYYETYIDKVSAVNPQQIQDLANKYLDITSFTKTIVGGI